MSEIRMLELSLRCFVLGLIGLVPVLGFVPALLSISCFIRVRTQTAGRWNVALWYLYAGFVSGGVGVFVSLILFGVALFALLVQ